MEQLLFEGFATGCIILIFGYFVHLVMEMLHSI